MRDLLNQIESPRFSAIAGLASGFKPFVDIVAVTDEFQKLLQVLRGSSAAVYALVRHTIDLSHRIADARYENPNDVALATYLYAVACCDRNAAKIAANAVLGLPRIWWANRMAEYTLIPVTADIGANPLAAGEEATNTADTVLFLPVDESMPLGFEHVELLPTRETSQGAHLIAFSANPDLFPQEGMEVPLLSTKTSGTLSLAA